MKKRNLLYAGLVLALILVLSSCFHDHDLHINVNDNDDEYRLRASFDDELTDDVQRVINSHIHSRHPGSTVYLHSDRKIELDNGANFRLRLRPGHLRIRFGRDENSEESYAELQDMCEEIKDVLASRSDQ